MVLQLIYFISSTKSLKDLAAKFPAMFTPFGQSQLKIPVVLTQTDGS